MSRRSLIDALLAPRIAALLDTLPAAVGGDVEGVHRARVASRRLREVLPPLAGVLPANAVHEARVDVRRVTRALGPVRELDVALALFDDLAGAHPLGAPAASAVRRRLGRARDAARRHARASLSASRQRQLAADLEALTTVAPADAAARIGTAVDARVLRRVAAVRSALHASGAMYVPERLHQVRIAVKRLRYALEVAVAARRTRATARLTSLKDLQDLLGRAHDLHVLGERIREVQTGVVRVSRATAADLEGLVTRIDIACRAEHAAFMTRRAGLRALCDALDPPAAATASRRSSVA